MIWKSFVPCFPRTVLLLSCYCIYLFCISSESHVNAIQYHWQILKRPVLHFYIFPSKSIYISARLLLAVYRIYIFVHCKGNKFQYFRPNKKYIGKQNWFPGRLGAPTPAVYILSFLCILVWIFGRIPLMYRVGQKEDFCRFSNQWTNLMYSEQ